MCSFYNVNFTTCYLVVVCRTSSPSGAVLLKSSDARKSETGVPKSRLCASSLRSPTVTGMYSFVAAWVENTS